MIDFKLLLRKAYFQALSGQVTYNANQVKFYSDVAELGSNDLVYVLMTNNSSSDRNTQQYFSSEEDFTLEVIFVAKTFANKSVVDGIANQILQIVLPNPQQNGLSQQPGISIINCYKSSDDYQTFQLVGGSSVVRRLITFSQQVTQGGFGTIIPVVPGHLLSSATLKYTSADFVNATDVLDPLLTGYDLTVFFNDNQIYLDEGLDFILISGGFRITIPGFNSSVDNYTFYVSILSN
jgi:hypothetical protein